MTFAPGLKPRRARLEYWYFKFRQGQMAFLVDFIVRGSKGDAEIRVSRWTNGRSIVDHHVSGEWCVSDGSVRIDSSTFAPRSSRGRAGTVAWDLEFDPGHEVDPHNAVTRLLRPFDMEAVSFPRARFRGQLEVDGQSLTVDAPGLLSHYWGHRLPIQWNWVSAELFDGSDIVLEATLIRSRLWGLRWPTLTTGYIFIDRAGRTELVVSPLNGLIRSRGDRARFPITAHRFGKAPISIICEAPIATSVDLGDNVRQTLVGTVVVDGRDRADRNAGVETRRVD